MSKISLYAIANEVMALEEMLLSDGGEVTVSHEELEAHAHQLIISKVDDYCLFIQKLEDEMDLADLHLKRIRAYKTAREVTIEKLRCYAQTCLERMNVPNIKGTLGSISQRKPSDILFIEDDQKVPEEFASYQRIIDKSSLKDAIKGGAIIDGAGIIPGKKSVMIKLKGVK